MEESNMVMEKSRSHLKALSQLAPQLNKATDLYMEELKEIEAELDKLNLGIAVELSTWIDKDNPKAEYNNDGEEVGVFYRAWTLGYGKDDQKLLAGHWCLLVRKYRVQDVPGDSMYATPTSDDLEEDVTPLLQASRNLRIAAAEYIPELLKVIEQEAKKKIEILGKVTDKR